MHDALRPTGVVNYLLEGVLADLQATTGTFLAALAPSLTLELKPSRPGRADPEAVVEQVEKVRWGGWGRGGASRDAASCPAGLAGALRGALHGVRRSLPAPAAPHTPPSVQERRVSGCGCPGARCCSPGASSS